MLRRSQSHLVQVMLINNNAKDQLPPVRHSSHSPTRHTTLKFLINGDPHYSGITILLDRNKICNFQSLLRLLSKKLPVSTQIPSGVHRIYGLDTSRQVRRITDLRDGEYYVCSGFDRLKNNPFFVNEKSLHKAMTNRRFDFSNVLAWNARQKTKKGRPFEKNIIKTREMKLLQDQMPPTKIVTVWEYGLAPAKKMSLMVSRNYLKMGNFSRFMLDIADYFSKIGRREKSHGTLYSIRGMIISNMNDMFYKETAFIFVPLTNSPKLAVIHAMLVNMYSDGMYTSHLVNCWSQVLKASNTKPNKKSFKETKLDFLIPKTETKTHQLDFPNSISKKAHQIYPTLQFDKSEKNKLKFVNNPRPREMLPKPVKRAMSPQIDVQASKQKSIEKTAKDLINLYGIVSPMKRPAKLPALNENCAKKLEFNDEYLLAGKIGDGNFSVVHRTKKITTGGVFAVKIVDKSKYSGKEILLKQEISILRQCVHENIIKLIQTFHTPTEVFMITELAEAGDLFDLIKANSKFCEKISSTMVKDITSALFYLHSRQIMHRDVKPENILVYRNKNGTNRLKLADFGLAMDASRLVYTVCGTPTYVAPEILKEIGYGIEVDLWALGVICYLFLVGYPPFRTSDGRQTILFDLIKRGSFSFSRPHWDSTSGSVKDMIAHLLRPDKNKRFKAIDVLCHPWILSQGNSLELPDQLSVLRSQSRLHLEREALKATQFRIDSGGISL